MALRWYLCWIWKGSALPRPLPARREAAACPMCSWRSAHEEAARSAVRFTLGIETTKEEIDITVDTVRRLTDKLREDEISIEF